MHRHIRAAVEHFETPGRDRDLDVGILWRALTALIEENKDMSDVFDGIRAALATQETLLGQAITLLDGMPAATAAAVAAATAGQAAEADAIVADVAAHTKALSDGIAAAQATGATAGAAVVTPAVPVAAPAAPAPAPGA